MKLSIIIPVYNVAPWLEACLASLAGQDWRDWEAVCVDDGSSDESGAMLDTWAARDARFRVFHKENGGVSSARNLGIRQAEGEHVWFVDADDVVPQGALTLIAKALEKSAGCDILMLRWRQFRDGAPLGFSVNGERDAVVVDDLGPGGSADRFSFYASRLLACNGVFRREKYAGQRFRGYRNAEDSLWGFEALASAGRVAYLAEPVYAYRDRAASARNTVDPELLQCYFDVAGETLDIARSRGRCAAYAKATEALAYKLATGTCAWVAMRLGRGGTQAWREGAQRLFARLGGEWNGARAVRLVRTGASGFRLFALVVLPGWLKFRLLRMPGMMKLWNRIKRMRTHSFVL